jgi:hypothetical protein
VTERQRTGAPDPPFGAAVRGAWVTFAARTERVDLRGSQSHNQSLLFGDFIFDGPVPVSWHRVGAGGVYR